MAQFDVHRVARNRLVVDCQAGLLSHLGTRFVIPLVAQGMLPLVRHLNFTVQIDGEDRLVATQIAFAMPLRDLGPVVTSLTHRSHDLSRAIDTLLTGV